MSSFSDENLTKILTLHYTNACEDGFVEEVLGLRDLETHVKLCKDKIQD